MNCELCKRELEAYREGKLPDRTRHEVEKHLENCVSCDEIYQLEVIANRVIVNEKAIEPIPFLSTRVMAGIEEIESNQQVPVYKKVLRPALITVSIAAAILIGIMTGNLYQPSKQVKEMPAELTYMDDVYLESVELLAID